MPKLKEKYDVIIIGAGLGGLECGYILSKEGYSVCILEKNAQIGGNLQTFKRDRVKFDSSVHYIGGIEQGQPLYPYFNFLNLIDTITYQKLDDEAYDIISFAGDANLYPHGQGYENFVAQLTNFFPEEEQNIRAYCDKVREVCGHFNMYDLYKPNTPINEFELFNLSAKQVIDQISPNQKLRNVLAGSNLLYAGEGDVSPFYVHALIVDSFIRSAYKLEGSDSIVKQLRADIRSMGGEIFINKEVVRIDNSHKKVNAVELKSGEQILGDIFISNIHPTLTFSMVDAEGIRKVYVERMQNLKNTISSFILYIKPKPGTFAFNNHNRYHFFQDDVWASTHMANAFDFRCLGIFNSADNKNPGFAETITVIAYMEYDWFGDWKNTHNTTLSPSERGAAYQEYKQKIEQVILSKVEEIYHGINEKIESYYSASPLTQRDYTGAIDGGIYGILRDFRHPERSLVRSTTKLENLYLTGQNTVLHGVLGVTIGAFDTCKNIVGEQKLINQILALR